MASLIKKIFDILTIRERIGFYFLLTAQIFMAGIEMAGIASIMPFMAVVANPKVIQTNFWLKQVYHSFEFTNLRSFLFFLGMVVLGVLVFSNLCKTLNTWLTSKYDNRLYYALAHRLLASYMARPYEFFLNRNTAEMGKNVLDEVRIVITNILTPCIQVLSGILISFCILTLLLVVNITIALAIVVVLCGSYAVIYLILRNKMARIGENQVEASRMKFKFATEALAGIKELKLLRKEKTFVELFAGHARLHAMNNASAAVIYQLPRYVMETIAFGGILLGVLISLRYEDMGHMVPILALYAFAGYRLMPALQQVFGGFSMIRVNLPALDILHRDIMEGRVVSDVDSILKETQKVQPLQFKHELVLKDITFYYPGTKEPVLKDINLTITPNTSIGIVGATGSGKTTLVDIILGLLKPTNGQMNIDGIEINDDKMISCWQVNLGYVPQQVYLCDDTITHNIAFGEPQQEIDMNNVTRAARIANLYEFIEEELPNGFNTVIGERGIRLSGGQRQRIGIARALYRNPEVLIMDEATSALDGITEGAVIDALVALSGEKTIITIAHRLTTVQNCDVIYIVENGCIVDKGTYDELLKSSQWFQVASQAKK